MNDRFRWAPPPEHFFPYLRWLNISLRGLHLVGIAGLAGGFLFDLPAADWLGYWQLALLALAYAYSGWRAREAARGMGRPRGGDGEDKVR